MALLRNRALDGDNVFVEIIGPASEDTTTHNNQCRNSDTQQTENQNYKDDDNVCPITPNIKSLTLASNDEEKFDTMDEYDHGNDTDDDDDDEIQKSLWDPIVPIIRKRKLRKDEQNHIGDEEEQYTGEIVCVILPKLSSGSQASEIKPNNDVIRPNRKNVKPTRSIVGTIMSLPGNNSNRCLLVPSSKCLPRFMTPFNTRSMIIRKSNNVKDENEIQKILCKAEYVYGSWSNNDKWPPCVNVQVMGETCNVEDETQALLIDNGVNHGEFTPQVLRDVEEAVTSGRTHSQQDGDLGWEPTKDMLKGRRDYRNERIFTIDPTTAKDLDDALHIKSLPDGRVEIGVHIADVSHFVKPDTHVDEEAERRSTTVYLVDRTVPMLPRPLCEIACSLNENVERLAFR